MIFLLAASLLWAASFGLIERHLSELEPSFVAAVRLLLSLLVFLPLLRPRRVPRSLLAPLLLVGAVQFGLMYVLYIAAFAHLAGHEVALFTVLTPLHVVLLEALVGRGLRGTRLLAALVAAALAVAAAALLQRGAPDAASLGTGFLLVQLANLCFALGQVAWRRLLAGRALPQASLFALPLAGGAALACAVAAARLPGLPVLTAPQWLTLLYLGVLPSGLGFFLWNVGATRTDATTLAALNNAKVPLGVLVALLVFGERTSVPHLLASSALLVLALLVGRAVARTPAPV